MAFFGIGPSAAQEQTVNPSDPSMMGEDQVWRQPRRLGKFGIGITSPDQGAGGPVTGGTWGTYASTPVGRVDAASLGARLVGPPPVTAADPSGIPAVPLPPDQTVLRRVLDTSTMMPPAPGSRMPEYVKRAEQANTPVDPNQPQYRMGKWGKVLGTLANFASGFGGRGPVEYVGPGATNGRFQRDVATQQAGAKAANADLANEKSLEDENAKMWQRATTSAHDAQMDELRREHNQDWMTWKNQDEANKTENSRLREQLNLLKTPDSLYAARTKDADRLGLKGDERKFYLANGKLREPSPAATPRQPTELETWSKAFERDYGRAPTADEIAQRHHAKAAPTFRDAAAIDKYSDKWYDGAVSKLHAREAQIEREFGKDDDLDKDGKAKKQAALDDAYHDYLTKTQEFEGRKKGYYAAVAGGKQIQLDDNGEPTGVVSGPASNQPFYPKLTETPRPISQLSKSRLDRTATRDDVQAYADKAKVPYAKAKQMFSDRGYKGNF